VDEAHVEHTVSLVKHQDLDMTEVDGALPNVVEQAAWRGHHDLDAVAKGADLAIHADAAEDGRRADGSMDAVRAHRLLHLQRQLTSRHHDEGANPARPGAATGVERLEHGEDEGRGLAGPGLGSSKQIVTLEDHRNGLGLDRRWLGVALIGYSTKGFWAQPKSSEGQSVS